MRTHKQRHSETHAMRPSKDEFCLEAVENAPAPPAARSRTSPPLSNPHPAKSLKRKLNRRNRLIHEQTCTQKPKSLGHWVTYTTHCRHPTLLPFHVCKQASPLSAPTHIVLVNCATFRGQASNSRSQAQPSPLPPSEQSLAPRALLPTSGLFVALGALGALPAAV
jgi:hypothetical protein